MPVIQEVSREIKKGIRYQPARIVFELAFLALLLSGNQPRTNIDPRQNIITQLNPQPTPIPAPAPK